MVQGKIWFTLPGLFWFIIKKTTLTKEEYIKKSDELRKNVLKVLNAAVANAENNKQLNIAHLFVKEAFVGKSLSMKRFRPRAKGRASPILKPYSNVTIILSESKKMESHGTKS